MKNGMNDTIGNGLRAEKKNGLFLEKKIGKKAGWKAGYKKIICMLMIAFCFVLPAISCGNHDSQDDKSGKHIRIFYVNLDEDRIEGIEYELQSEDVVEQIKEAIVMLSTTPKKKELKATISLELGTPDCTLDEEQLTIRFNENYSLMPPTKEVLVRAAIVRTLCQLEGVSFVQFNINGEPLLNSSGELVGKMNSAQFIDNDGKEISAYDEVTIQLYFANESGDKLVPVKRTVEYNTNVSMEKLVMEQLLKGPDESGGYATINPATKVNNITITDGICYVNLSKEFLTQVYNLNSEVTIYSIVNSLVELNNVNKVQILVDGDSKLTFRETISLESTFGRNLDLIEAK